MNEMILSTQKIFLIFSILVISVNSQFHEDPCIRKVDNRPGVCEYIENCPSARAEFDAGVRPQICSFVNRRSIICCLKETQNQSPTTTTTTYRPAPRGERISAAKCREYKKLIVTEFSVGSLLPIAHDHKIKSVTDCIPATSLIVGGEAAKAGEFPHMAAIGWNYNGELHFACGGSLISEKFVLTAAHCLRKNNQPPNVIKLGEQHLQSDADGAQPQEFSVKRTIKHEEYSIRFNYYDIGLIELNRPAEFTKFVRPACLGQDYSIGTTNATATGWGLLEYSGSQSEELQKVSLTLMQNRDCIPFFENLSRYMKKSLNRGIVESQICAAAIEGGRLVGGKDTCNGDSGGPLQVTLNDDPCIYHVIGLTSFSFPGCANANSPGVYTRVSSYLDWIESHVWP